MDAVKRAREHEVFVGGKLRRTLRTDKVLRLVDEAAGLVDDPERRHGVYLSGLECVGV